MRHPLEGALVEHISSKQKGLILSVELGAMEVNGGFEAEYYCLVEIADGMGSFQTWPTSFVVRVKQERSKPVTVPRPSDGVPIEP